MLEMSANEGRGTQLRRFVAVWVLGAAGTALLGGLSALASIRGEAYLVVMIVWVALIGGVGIPVAALGGEIHRQQDN
jgi:hypothetical protein